MKVIFLDFNGVLDTNETMNEINPDNLQRLKRIVDETGAKIVITSSLKNNSLITGHISKGLQKIIEEIEQPGIEVIGLTPQARSREEEIKLYLSQHQEIENYCILDDDYEMEDLKDHLVKLPSQMQEGQMGLDEIHMIKAINILNNSVKKLRR